MSSISFNLGYRYLRSKKGGIFSFTTILAILGLSIGVASLIIVTSVMNGFQKELENRILGVIPHAIVYNDDYVENYEELIEKINANNDVYESSPYIEIQALISSSSDNKPVSLIGIEPDKEKKLSILPQYMIIGDFENLNNKNSVIIGSSLAANLGAYVGDNIVITTPDIKSTIIGSYPLSVTLQVVGIYELRTEIDQYLVLTSHKTAQKLKKFSTDQTESIRIKTTDLFKADLIGSNIALELGNSFYISSWKDTHGTLFEAIKFEKLLISLMLFLIVAVASILVLSTIVMTVKSKEREIGILLTLGASNKQIVLIFFTQGLIVTLIGIFVGILLGFLLIYNLNNFISVIESMLDRNLLEAYFINYFPYYINFGQISLICFFSFLISLISSLIPSLRAVRLNPVEILRHE